MKTWKGGPPPSLGWWPASTARMPGVFRWWDGKAWSLSATAGFSPEEAAACATIPVPAEYADAIEWTERPDDWPEHART